MIFKRAIIYFFIMIISGLLLMHPFNRVYASKDIVIMIDPGHGGANMGGQIPGLDEKNATLITASAMKEELEKYQGVTVYLTRTDDTELSLEERVKAASRVNADYLLSLHYNMSVSHRLYGAEVFIQSEGADYSRGYTVADSILNELCDKYGLLRRGIKTKVTDRGKEYYGILRHGTNYGITTMIVEHCHLDNERDLPFGKTEEKQTEFGKRDAFAVARALGLKPKDGKNAVYNYSPTVIPHQKTQVIQDKTPPEEVKILNAVGSDMYTIASVSAWDSQSPVIYYDYSVDNGETWSQLFPFSPGKKTEDIIIPRGCKLLSVRCYNNYDGFTQSETVPVRDISDKTDIFKAIPIVEGDPVYKRINGKSFAENPDIKISELRYLKVLHYDFNHKIAIGEIIVNKAIAEDALEIFRELFEGEYEINSIRLIDDFWKDGGLDSDNASMAANNSSGFCYRKVADSNRLSNHAFGRAIDINPLQNPYIRTRKDGTLSCEPEDGKVYMDRSIEDPHIIKKGDICYNAFIKRGFGWGGEWNSSKDYQHFEKK